jgi:hypothetical protein
MPRTKKLKKKRRTHSQQGKKRQALEAVKIVKDLQKTGVIESRGYSLELPFSRRLSSYGVIR